MFYKFISYILVASPCVLEHADVAPVHKKEVKHADVAPVHKKEVKSGKAVYRPVSIPPNLSKIYEKLIYQQLYEHFNSILSQKQCGFRKGYSAQHYLMVMLEKLKESRN